MAVPALQLKVTLEEVNVEPGTGLTITAEPGAANAWQTEKSTATTSPKEAQCFIAASVIKLESNTPPKTNRTLRF